jgi:hypothetical protein
MTMARIFVLSEAGAPPNPVTPQASTATSPATFTLLMC